MIDEGATLERAEAEADLLYLAQPILTILELLPRLKPKAGSLVTDAGSTKSQITAVAMQCLKDCQFVGGHPMAGKETRGVASADADLFRGRNYVLTPSEDTPSLQWFRARLAEFGAHVTVLDPEEHDRVVAYTSHLPQILSTMLAATLTGIDQAPRIAGPALLDMTRIAQSPFDMWHDIFLTNRAAIEQALDAFLSQFSAARSEFYRAEFSRSFDEAAKVSRRLRRVKDFDDAAGEPMRLP